MNLFNKYSSHAAEGAEGATAGGREAVPAWWEQIYCFSSNCQTLRAVAKPLGGLGTVKSTNHVSGAHISVVCGDPLSLW